MAHNVSNVGTVKRLWWSWKMLPLPWRRRRLAGFDLDGNTYWEWKIAKHAKRTRRIVEYPGGVHHSDVNVPPQWAQWLRQTRADPPTADEQHAEAWRQERIKLLAAQADARWAAKPSAVDQPDKQQPVPVLESPNPTTGTPHQATSSTTSAPWQQPPQANPGADWQPESWSPPPAATRKRS